jgi:hypothetical protein
MLEGIGQGIALLFERAFCVLWICTIVYVLGGMDFVNKLEGTEIAGRKRRLSKIQQEGCESGQGNPSRL